MRSILLYLFAAILCVACVQGEVEDYVAPREELPETIFVGFEGDDTRIQLSEGLKSVWNKGDLVSVFYKSDSNDCWEFIGETGDRNGELRQVGIGSVSRTADNVVVVYPYDERYVISLAANTVELSIPAVQSYTANSFGVGSSPMIASSDFNKFKLKNVCGWFKLSLTGSGERVTAVSLRGNNGEQVAGRLLVNADDASCVLAITTPDVEEGEIGGALIGEEYVSTLVRLESLDGVVLSEEPTAFYIAVAPQRFDSGITVCVECADGSRMVQKSENIEIKVERNTIKPMASFEYIPSDGDFDTEEDSNEIPNNEIWYTTTNGEAISFNKSVSGATLLSNTYENGKGVLRFDSDITRLDSNAFNGNTRITTITLPESVKSVDSQAFNSMQNLERLIGVHVSEDGLCYIVDGELQAFIGVELEEYEVPQDVVSIGDSLFSNNEKLKYIRLPENLQYIGDYVLNNCAMLQEIEIPESVVEMGEYVLLNCPSLKQFKGVYASDDGAALIFNNKLKCYLSAREETAFRVPQGVTVICQYAFSDCVNLTTLYIPESVCEFENYAVYGWNSLTAIYMESLTPPIFDYAPFGYSINDNLRIYVYEEAVDLYKTELGGLSDRVVSNGESPSTETTTIQYFTANSTILDISGLPIVSHEYKNAKEGALLVVAGSLRYVPSGLFSNQADLTSIKLPDSICRIQDSAFAGCSSLNRIAMGANVEYIGASAFSGCSTLDVIELPSQLTTIEDSTFEECTALKSVTMGNDIRYIGNRAFYNCSKIEEITLPENLKFIGDYAFYKSMWNGDSYPKITLSHSVEHIGTEAFVDCNCDITINCPVGDNYFVKSRFRYVTLGEGITHIGKGAFAGASISSLTFADSVTHIGDRAFEEGRVNISKQSSNIQYVGERTFANSTITHFSFASDVSYIGQAAFLGCNKLKTIDMPERGIEKLPDSVFDGCSSLISIDIPKSIKRLGSYSLAGCTSLTCVVIPEGVTHIEDYAFARSFGPYEDNTEVRIPASVIEIGYGAFMNCKGLDTVYCYRATPPGLGAQAFRSYDGEWYYNLGCRIYVRPESLELYLNAGGWKAYRDDIVAYDFE